MTTRQHDITPPDLVANHVSIGGADECYGPKTYTEASHQEIFSSRINSVEFTIFFAIVSVSYPARLNYKE